ncbi:MAG: perosamine synthetase [Pyrococcus sp.]|uniref:DegT/DnrJ/EryC1/StrS family aminotransferase n=1 Tax=Pyrococcus sp. TaxID=33866 RepID=UPI00184FCDD3|nr:DegT/DnrJ/EryC1/StrS family aminotransferase [Pyrococcus sp.]MDK2870581.1 perosamine synthetase [Pyrococcus sp.]HIH72543.1 DegT/DnrJ/EryC1/StrS family aminotransferase [Thermococcaceae archaeon]
MKINLIEPVLNRKMMKAAISALKNEFFLRGESVKKFEEEFANYIGTEYAVAVSSGTAALHISLLALGVGQGDVVITTPATFISTANAIVYVGAKPIFVDISLSTYTIDPNEIEKTIKNYKNRVKAIIPVHLYGYPSNMDEIMEISEKYGIPIVEDACQAHGAEYKNKKLGSFGDAAAFSFYPSKNMTVAGDGGMITTNDYNIAEVAKQLRDVGRSKNNSYLHDFIGFTARMNTVNAAIGRVQLKYLDKWNRKRRRIARRYSKELEGVGDIILPPKGDRKIKPVWHLYVIRTKYRDELKKFLEERGIQSGIHYPVPVHLQPPYRKMGFSEGLFPNSERWAREVLSIPLHPKLSNEDVGYVIESIKEFYKKQEADKK